MPETNVVTPLLTFPWGGPGSGITAAPHRDEIPYADACTVLHPDWIYRPTGTIYYYSPVSGNNAWDGTSPTFVSGTTGPKATFAAAYALLAASGETLVQVDGEINEGELGTLTKSFSWRNHLGSDAHVDGRGAAMASWTRDGAFDRWRHAHTCSHTPAENTGQAGIRSTSATFSNQDPTWDTRIQSLAAVPVSWNGEMIQPAAPGLVSSLTRVGTTATCVTSASHGLTTGDSVTITNVDRSTTTPLAGAQEESSYDGCFTVAVVNSTTFTYTVVVTAATGTNAERPDLTAAAATAHGIRWVSKYQVTGTRTYYHDNRNAWLWVGENPSGVTIRAARWRNFATLSGAVDVRGICFVGFAARYGDPPYNCVIEGTTSAQTFENCGFYFSPGDGIKWSGAGLKVFEHNAVGWMRTGVSFTSGNARCRWNFGAFFDWLYGDMLGWHEGLFKVVTSGPSDVLIMFNRVRCCNGPGVWYDFVEGSNNKVLHNRIELCANMGVSNEVNNEVNSNAYLVAGNLLLHDYWGLSNVSSSDLKRFMNTLFGCSVPLRTYSDDRAVHNVEGGTLDEIANIAVMAATPLLPGHIDRCFNDTQDGQAGGADASGWYGTYDYQVFHTESGVALTADVSHDTGATVSTFTHANWRSTYPSLNPNGIRTTLPGAHPLMKPSAGDYRPSTAVFGRAPVFSATNARALGPSFGLPDVTAPVVPGANRYPGARVPRFAFVHRFTGADSASVSGLSETKQSPTPHAGSPFGIASNKGYFSVDTNLSLVSWPCDVHDGHFRSKIEGQLNSAGNYRVPCPTFRHVAGAEATTFLFLRYRNGSMGLVKMDAGVQTDLATQAGLTTTNGVQYDVLVVFEGADVAVYVNDALVLSHALSAANSKYRGGARVGCLLLFGGTLSPGSPARVDDMLVMRA